MIKNKHPRCHAIYVRIHAQEQCDHYRQYDCKNNQTTIYLMVTVRISSLFLITITVLSCFLLSTATMSDSLRSTTMANRLPISILLRASQRGWPANWAVDRLLDRYRDLRTLPLPLRLPPCHYRDWASSALTFANWYSPSEQTRCTTPNMRRWANLPPLRQTTVYRKIVNSNSLTDKQIFR